MMWLLGAGASRDVGLPDACGLTDKILASAAGLDRPGGDQAFSPLLKFVCGAILFQKSQAGLDPTKERVNVEALFNAVQFLSRRAEWEYLPFVNGFHPMIEQLAYKEEFLGPRGRQGLIKDVVQSVTKLYKLNAFKEVVLNEATVERLSRAIDALTQGPDERRVDLVQYTLKWMINELDRLLQLDVEASLDYLLPMVTGDPQHSIASLNYDYCVEAAAQKKGVQVQTNIESWRPGRYDAPANAQPLLKLHGSLDWEYEGDSRSVQADHIRVTPTTRANALGRGIAPLSNHRMVEPESRALIFGGANKLTVKGPFLDLLAAFQHRLSESPVLVIVGYSFSDEHINHQIRLWLNRPEGKMYIINGPDFTAKAFDLAISIQKPRSTYGESTFGDRLQIVPMFAAEGIAEVSKRLNLHLS